ncbi:hypothetical protein WISP_106136 [Willisornis vidua]|uniref:Regulator of microtubule dynamics protein 1 n=1 Tax=Willisornis vidua TaxID=1566151 RepID=A0ABQ9CWX9_9PASS|nr:hypothetical protein WISP_106136 [Willisornis vidua]
MATLMAVLARPFRRGPADLGQRLRRETTGGPWGRGRPGSEVLRKSLQRGVVLSTGSLLVYEAHKLLSGFAEVHASFKVEEVIEQADYLYGSGETEKLYRLLVQHKNSDDAELLWRLARSSRDLAQLSSTSAEEKRQLTYDSLEYAKKALEKNESNSAAHKWYGICLSDVGDYEGIKTKIGNAIVIKEHFQRAIELNPKDATTIHLIGIWCYSFAEMPWYQRKIAATLFATPPTSTFQEIIRLISSVKFLHENWMGKTADVLNGTNKIQNYLDKLNWKDTIQFVTDKQEVLYLAEEVVSNAAVKWNTELHLNFASKTPPYVLNPDLRSSSRERCAISMNTDPNFYSKNLLFLGKTYLKLNNKKMALLWLSKAKEYPAQTEEDKQVVNSDVLVAVNICWEHTLSPKTMTIGGICTPSTLERNYYVEVPGLL